MEEMDRAKPVSGFIILLFLCVLLSSCTTDSGDQNISLDSSQSSYGRGDASSAQEDIPIDVDYVYAQINGTVKKVKAGDSFENFRIISAQSTYLPNQLPFGDEENSSQYFERENYFLWSATLEMEGTFPVSGELSQDLSEQYSQMWVLQLDEASTISLPQIIECEPNSKIYLPNYDKNSNKQGDMILSKICLRYGQNDGVSTGE